VAAGLLAPWALAGGSLAPAAQAEGPAPGPPAPAGRGRVASFGARGGVVFRDTVTVDRIPDPSVEGVTLFLSSVERPLTDRLSKDFFGDPASASLAVARTGPVRFARPIPYGPEGEEVHRERRSLLFKSTRIRRVYDEATRTLLYVAYSTDWSSGAEDQRSPNSRYRTAVAALPLHGAGAG